MSNELETKGVTDLAVLGDIRGSMEKPSNLDMNDRSGTEDIGLNEIRLAKLAIAQGLSKQMVPGEGVYIKGLAIGEMFNDVTSEIYGSGPLLVVPVLRHVSRVEFDPNNKGVPLDRNVPANDPRMDWVDNKPPRATEYVQFVCLLLRSGKEPEKIIVSIKTTNKHQKAAAELWTTLIYNRKSAIYTGMYDISSKIEKGKNKEGQETLFGVFVVKNAGYIPTDSPAGAALYQMAKEFHLGSKGKNVALPQEEDPDAFNEGSFREGETVGDM